MIPSNELECGPLEPTSTASKPKGFAIDKALYHRRILVALLLFMLVILV